jgi:hypothetical protein
MLSCGCSSICSTLSTVDPSSTVVRNYLHVVRRICTGLAIGHAVALFRGEDGGPCKEEGEGGECVSEEDMQLNGM